MSRVLVNSRLQKRTWALVASVALGLLVVLGIVAQVKNREALFTVNLPAPNTGLAFMEDGKVLAMSDSHGTIMFWDTAAKHQLPLVIRTGGRILALQASAKGSVVAVWGFALSGGTNFLRLWDIKSGQEIKISGLPPTERFTVSPNGKMLVSLPANHRPLVWDISSRRFLADVPVWAIYNIAFSSDGRMLFTESSGAIHRFATTTWQREGTYGTQARRVATDPSR